MSRSRGFRLPAMISASSREARSYAREEAGGRGVFFLVNGLVIRFVDNVGRR